ncbi:MAG: GntR family transcriptional regulator [Hyphomicrobiales bacterium]|nr:GntR family transcriptional regulator [Hyphomicrobiales bacterium]
MPETKSLEKEKAYGRILDLILRGEISHDEALAERRLAETLRIGRTPVREAIKDLVREGVLEAHPTRGTFVRQLSLRDVQEIYQVRYAIEGLAAFLAAERGPTQALLDYGPDFRATIATPETCDVAQVYDHGAEFHVEIFRCAGNRNLLEIYRPIRLRFRIALGLPRHHDPERVLESVREHLEILEAIEARDGELAQKLICDHLHKGLQVRTRLFQGTSTHAPAAVMTPSARG